MTGLRRSAAWIATSLVACSYPGSFEVRQDAAGMDGGRDERDAGPTRDAPARDVGPVDGGPDALSPDGGGGACVPDGADCAGAGGLLGLCYGGACNTTQCLIDDLWVAAGAIDSARGECYVCDPTVERRDWTLALFAPCTGEMGPGRCSRDRECCWEGCLGSTGICYDGTSDDFCGSDGKDCTMCTCNATGRYCA